MPLEVVPIFQEEAKRFLAEKHRHLKKLVGCVFCLAVADGDTIHGVALVGRPVARGYQDGFTLEVNRCCTDGTPNACSMLYAAAWRTARAMGYRRLVTYILETEPGTSVRAAGWREIGRTTARKWSCKSRPRVERRTPQAKICFAATK